MSVSLAAKVGAAGTITAGSGLTATYFAWDHITLYSVEREVINKDVKLKAESGDNNKSITVSVDSTSTSIPWICKITSDPEGDLSTNSASSTLAKYIKSHLQTEKQDSINDKQKRNKELLVKACSKKRTPDTSDKSVTGLLTLKKTGDKFTFKDQTYLDFFLNHSLFEVEEKIIEGDLELNVEEIASPTPKKIKVIVKGDDWKDETKGYYWECTITGSGDVNPNKSTWENKLFRDKSADVSDKATKLENNKKFIKKCAENRAEGENKKVKANFTISSSNTEDTLISSIFGS